MRSIDRRLAPGRALRALVLGALMLLAGAGHALAGGYVGAGGGVFIPYKGQVGWSVNSEIGGSLFGSRHYLGTTEFEFRRAYASPSGAGNTEDSLVDSYHLRLLGRFVFNPEHFTPYFGGGGGLALLNSTATSTRSAEFGLAASVLGILGLQTPIAGSRFTVYAETRFGYTWDLTGDFAHINQKGFDGFTGVGGLRFWF